MERSGSSLDQPINGSKLWEMEKDIEHSPEGSGHTKEGYGVTHEVRGGMVHRFVDSFKRNPHARVTTEAVDSEGRPVSDTPIYEPALAMKLKSRHLQMIAIGGSIGTLTSHTD